MARGKKTMTRRVPVLLAFVLLLAFVALVRLPTVSGQAVAEVSEDGTADATQEASNPRVLIDVDSTSLSMYLLVYLRMYLSICV